jgi:serine/threonine protein kinase
MHKAGYYHRDVTPLNILNTIDGEAVNLIDFGISMPTWAIGSSRRILDQLMSDKKISEDEILLQAGNPNFTPAISYLGGYNYVGDLEGLCYTLEAIYSKGHLLPWVPKGNKEVKQVDAYKLRLSFTPTIPAVRELLDYTRSIGNEMPDYEKCMDFFLKK